MTKKNKIITGLKVIVLNTVSMIILILFGLMLKGISFLLIGTTKLDYKNPTIIIFGIIFAILYIILAIYLRGYLAQKIWKWK